MDRIAFKAKIENAKRVLDNPDMYKDAHVMILTIDDRYYKAMREWAKQHRMWMDNVMVSIGFPHSKWTERAKRFYFLVRDAVCKEAGDTTRSNKDAVHHGAMDACEFRHPDGEAKKHIDELDKRELYELTQYMKRLIEGTEFWYPLAPQWNCLREDYGRP